MSKNTEVEINEHTCPTVGCGISFWLTTGFENRRRSDKETFYCLNGHSLSYTGESDQQKISRLIEEKKQIIREKDLEIKRIKKECSSSKKRKKKTL